MYRIKPSRAQCTFEGFIAYNLLGCKAKSGAKSTKKWSIPETVSKIYFPAKGIPEEYDIFFVSSRHVECVVKLERR